MPKTTRDLLARSRLVLLLSSAAIGLSACGAEAVEQVIAPRPVKAVIVKHSQAGVLDQLVGVIAPRDEVLLAFRSDGQLIERLVSVGDRVEAGQLIARLDDEDQRNQLRSAEASLAAAKAALNQAVDTERRLARLLKKGVITRVAYDEAELQLKTAQSNVESAEAQLAQARDRLAYTRLTADSAGIVTAIGGDPGEIVRVGQMIATIASGNEKDAVFDVPGAVMRAAPKDIDVLVSLADDSTIQVTGNVREISPQADPVTRTFKIRVALIDPPPTMRLGATVVGRAAGEGDSVIALPATALTENTGDYAVWSVDPVKLTVALRNVTLARHDTETVLLSGGLDDGDIVVTAGVHTLHEGQQVRLLD